MPSITVALQPSYTITIEPRSIKRLGSIVQEVAPSNRAMLIVDANVAASYGRSALSCLESAGYTVQVTEVIAEESRKSLDEARSLYEAMLRARLDRTSPVIAIGGGITGDLAGFAAATFMRGLPLIHVPTTLLAMVDAAIGGKTGVNCPLPDGALGKNMIGSFHQPRAVIADPETLRSLDPRELRCGLAECIKHAVIADADLLSSLRENLSAILSLDMTALTTLIERSAKIKVAIVETDERESGRRALLNLGHTFAHAIESFLTLNLKHGEAVAIGLAAAARAAVVTNRLSESDAQQIESIIDQVGLPRNIPKPISPDALITAMGYDKKAAQGQLRLILPTAIGRAEIVSDVLLDIITGAWAHVGAQPT